VEFAPEDNQTASWLRRRKASSELKISLFHNLGGAISVASVTILV